MKLYKNYIKDLVKNCDDSKLISWNFSYLLLYLSLILFLTSPNLLIKNLALFLLLFSYFTLPSIDFNWLTLFYSKKSNHIKFISKLDGRDWNYKLFENNFIFIKLRLFIILKYFLILIPFGIISYNNYFEFNFLLINLIFICLTFLYFSYYKFINFIAYENSNKTIKEILKLNFYNIKHFGYINLLKSESIFLIDIIKLILISFIISGITSIMLNISMAVISFFLAFIMFGFKMFAYKSGFDAMIYFELFNKIEK